MGSLWLTTTGLLLLSCGCVSSFFFSSSSKPLSHDLSYKEIQAVYRQRVEKVRMMERPLDNSLGESIKGVASHSGVEVVIEDGRHFLIHKGKDYGSKKGGDTVVVDVKHMTEKWKPVTDWKVPNKETRVTDMVRAGGKDYRWFRDNCHHASKNMMYGGGKKDKGIFLKPQVPKEDRIPKSGEMGHKKLASKGLGSGDFSGKYGLGSGDFSGKYGLGSGGFSGKYGLGSGDFSGKYGFGSGGSGGSRGRGFGSGGSSGNYGLSSGDFSGKYGFGSGGSGGSRGRGFGRGGSGESRGRGFGRGGSGESRGRGFGRGGSGESRGREFGRGGSGGSRGRGFGRGGSGESRGRGFGRGGSGGRFRAGGSKGDFGSDEC